MKKNKAKTVIAFAPPRLGGLEVLCPIITELQQEGYSKSAWLIFPSGVKSAQQLKRDTFLQAVCHRIFSGMFVCGRIIAYILLLPVILLCGLLRKQVLLLYPEGMTGRMGGRLKRLPWVNVVTYPKVMTIPRGKQAEVAAPAKASALSLVGNENAIGFPKFYESWQEKVVQMAQEMSEQPQHILVFLPSVVDGVFSCEELEVWFADVALTIRETQPDMMVVIKPHPMMGKDRVEALCQQASMQQPYRIGYDSAALLLCSAHVVISHHSSVILDSLAAGVPTVFYQEFTLHWLEIHPEKSHFLGIGAVHVDTLEALQKYLSQKDTKKSVNKTEFFKKIGHRNRLLDVLKERGVLQ